MTPSQKIDYFQGLKSGLRRESKQDNITKPEYYILGFTDGCCFHESGTPEEFITYLLQFIERLLSEAEEDLSKDRL